MYFDKIKVNSKENRHIYFVNHLHINSITKRCFIASVCGKYATQNFGDLFALYMERAKVTVEELSEKTEISDRTLTRMRTDPEYNYRLKTVVAICIALSLSEYESHKLINCAGFELRKGSMLHDAYALLLCISASQGLSILQCNQKLSEWGLEPLI